MIVMPSNNTGIAVGYLAGKYPGRLGHLFSPGGERGPYPYMPYALDNGAYGAFTRKQPWQPGPWQELLEWAANSGQQPRWCLIPDVVGDRLATMALWQEWADLVRVKYGWPLAFAAQDGMTPFDVPKSADVVFLGGSTEWKRQAIRPFCEVHRRVHVGRINTYRWLRFCEEAGAESIDGTGWTRGDNEQWRGLEQWLREVSGESPRTIQELCDFGPIDGQTDPGGKSSSTPDPVACGDDQ